MKRAFFLMMITFGITVAVIFTARASADALGIVIGVVLGVLASVPTTLLVVYIFTRPRPDLDKYSPPAIQPPVVVISPSNLPAQSYSPAPSLPALTPAPSRRAFTIIGDEGTEGE